MLLQMILITHVLMSSMISGCATPGANTHVLASGFVRPWGMAFLPDGLLITEIGGRIWRIDLEDGDRRLVARYQPADLVNLLDVLVDGSDVYLSVQTNNGLRLVVGRYSNRVLKFIDTLEVATGKAGVMRHAGGRISLQDHDTLLLSVGDEAPSSAQSPVSRFGKIVAVHDIHRHPRIEIVASGVRNVQGIVAVDDQVYFIDHGAEGNDTLHLLIPGANYGWPGGDGAAPVLSWTPAVAPSSLTRFKSDLLISSLIHRSIWRLRLGDAGAPRQTCVLKFPKRVRRVKVEQTDEVYILTDAGELFLQKMP